MTDTETEKSYKEGDCQREEHSTQGLPRALLMQKHEGREEVVTEGRCRHGSWGAGPRGGASKPGAGGCQAGKHRNGGDRGKGRGRRRKAASPVLTVTDVRFVVVFLRGGVMPPPAACRATGLGRHWGFTLLVILIITTGPEHVLCEAPSASPAPPPSSSITSVPIPTRFYRPGN